MFSIHIGIREAIVALRDLAASFPEGHTAVNPDPKSDSTCTYAVRIDGKLSAVCIVGQWLESLGLLGLTLVDPTSKNYYVDQHGACSVGSEIWNRLSALGITVSDDAQRFMREAQSFQDNGFDTGETVENEYGDLDEVKDFTWTTAVREAASIAHERLARELPTFGLV